MYLYINIAYIILYFIYYWIHIIKLLLNYYYIKLNIDFNFIDLFII